MSGNSQKIDDILDQFMLEYPEPSREAVEDFIRKFPEFHAEILEFAVAWAEDHVLPDADPFTAEQADRLIDRNDSYIANYFYERDGQSSNASVSKVSASASHAQRRTLKQLSEAAGMSLPELAAKISLDISVIAKLNSCFIRPETIPSGLFDLASTWLRESKDIIRVSVCGPPRFTANAAYLSKEKPSVPGQVTFQEAVIASQMAPSDKKKWLLETV